MVLVVLSMVEQRHAAVLEVLKDGRSVTEVAARYGVSRQTVHTWLRRYANEGLAGLADRSHRPQHCPHQMPDEIERVLIQLRGHHPRWGPARLAWELEQRGAQPVPSLSAIYRALVRNELIVPRPRRRKREDFTRWERDTPMQLWQLDVTAGVRINHDEQAQLVTGVDDHSRFCVLAAVVQRATSRSVCAAFAASLRRYGIPDEVLTDNGKVFTSRFGSTKGEVLFERICRENGIKTRLTAPRSPTTTGKIERFHQTIKNELLRVSTFVDLEAAQAAINTWVAHYNTERPHQALQMRPPAYRFRPRPGEGPQPHLFDLPPRTPPVIAQRRISPVGQVRLNASVYSIGRHLGGRLATVAVYDAKVKFYVDGVLVATRQRQDDTATTRINARSTPVKDQPNTIRQSSTGT